MNDDKLLTRIGALLRQAEGTDNEHEAAAFTEAAQRLATAASIDLAVARAHHRSNSDRGTAPAQRTVRIGEPGKRGLRTYVELFVAIARSNDVRCDIAANSTFVFAYGFDTDIDACEALYASLVIQMVRASDAYIKSGAYRGETVEQLYEERYTGRRWIERKPVAAVTARINFQTAFAARIGARLAEVRQRETADRIAHGGAESGTALALRDKEVELASFYRQVSTARGRWRGSAATAGYSDGARRAGDRAGRNARIGGHHEIGGSRGAIGRSS